MIFRERDCKIFHFNENFWTQARNLLQGFRIQLKKKPFPTIWNWQDSYTRIPEMTQKVFEGDILFSIFIGRFFLDQSKSRTQHLLRRLFGPSQGPPCMPSAAKFWPCAKISCNNLEWSQVKIDMTLLKSNKCKINMSIGPWKWLVSDYALYPLNFRISDIIMQIIIRSRTNIEWKFDKNWKKWHLNLITFLYLTGMINKIIMVCECRIYKSF